VTITFNVVFTPGTVRRLLPFTLSLLQGTGVHLRLVANGCGPEEVDLMREAAAGDERVSQHSLPGRDPVAHGAALNQLFDAFPIEPYFAFADSDVIASGDFMPALWPMADGQTGVFAATPVWATESDTVVPAGWPVLSGRMHVLPDGSHAGSTYLAIYERAAIEPSWRAAPRGFELHFRHSVPRAMRARLAARGWSYRIFDTCRVVNLQQLMEGRTLEVRDVPQLHHVGGVSGANFAGPSALLRGLPLLLRSKHHRRPTRIAEYVAFRYFLWRRGHDPRHRLVNDRRSLVGAFAGAVLDAIEAGEQVPPPPATGSTDVDRQLAALIAAIEGHYRPLP